jgi:pimeloyl-ACP methyl ester carboxylesterase
MKTMQCLLVIVVSACFTADSGAAPAAASAVASPPEPPGSLVNLGGHKLHVNCQGKGRPIVVVENGFGDFSFDWVLVQNRVAEFTRICTYDRAGYAWSDRGPQPRTFAQINLELHDALAKLGEHGPFVLVGHSYGGPVVRNYALTYPQEVAGMVQVDATFEGQRVGMGGKATLKLGSDAKGKSIPAPGEAMKPFDKPATSEASPAAGSPQPLDAMYKVLPPAEQKWQLWAQDLSEINEAENSQREWSGEYFAKWLAQPQAGVLGAIPLIVLTRAEGGFDNDLDVPAAQLENERKDGQARLVQLSTNGTQLILQCGHNMELEAPADVAEAIRRVVESVRKQGKR